MNGDLIFNVLSRSMSQEHLTVIDHLSEPKQDEELAEELDLKETVVRTLLNDLHYKNLVEFERTKNKRTGWYTYLWKKRQNKIEEYAQDYLQQRRDELQKKLEYEKNNEIFHCDCSRGTIKEVMEYDFYCPECEEYFRKEDNSELVSEIEEKIAEINYLLQKTQST